MVVQLAKVLLLNESYEPIVLLVIGEFHNILGSAPHQTFFCSGSFELLQVRFEPVGAVCTESLKDCPVVWPVA